MRTAQNPDAHAKQPTSRVAAIVLLGLLLTALPGEAGNRAVFSVPDWRDFDGARWGGLVLEETTRAAFEQHYSSRRTDHANVLQATTSNRSGTEHFLIFDGPGQDARLAWILCFYDSDRGAPRPADFLVRQDAWEITGYPALQRAGWRLFTEAGGGVGAVGEREGDRLRVVALIMGRPERMTALARRLRPPVSGGESTVGGAGPDPYRARIGRIDVNVQVSPNTAVDRVELQREIQVEAEDKAGDWPVLQVAAGSAGRLAIELAVEPVAPGAGSGIRLTSQATLDAEGAGGDVHARSERYQRDLGADSSQGRLEEEARQLVERGIDAVAGSAQIQLQRQQEQSREVGRREARLALIDFLAGEADENAARSGSGEPSPPSNWR
jgi:hypothetical protein